MWAMDSFEAQFARFTLSEERFGTVYPDKTPVCSQIPYRTVSTIFLGVGHALAIPGALGTSTRAGSTLFAHFTSFRIVACLAVRRGFAALGVRALRPSATNIGLIQNG